MLTLHGLCWWTTLCILHLKHTLVSNYVLDVQQRQLHFLIAHQRIIFQVSPRVFIAAHWAICVLPTITWVFAASLLVKISSRCLTDLLEKNMRTARASPNGGDTSRIAAMSPISWRQQSCPTSKIPTAIELLFFAESYLFHLYVVPVDVHFRYIMRLYGQSA